MNPNMEAESREELKNKELSESDELGYHSDSYQASRRFDVPDSALEKDSEVFGSQELDDMQRYKEKLRLKKRKSLGRRKKVDIPHEGIGNEVYMIVHLGFESSDHGMVMDDSGLHNNGKMTSLSSITVMDSKCGSALRMRDGQLLFDSKTFHGTPREAVTIAMWIKLDSLNNLYNLFATEGNGSKYTLQVVNGKVHWSHLDDHGLVIFSMETDPIVNSGDWAHVGATYDSRTNFSKVIVNGQVIGENEGHGKLSQNWDGKTGIGLSTGIQGVVDEFYMYNRAHAASDIGDLSEQCNLDAGQAIPTKEGSYNGLIPEHMIEEALAKLKGIESNNTTTPPASPTLQPPTPLPTTTQTTLSTTTPSTTTPSTTTPSTTTPSTTTPSTMTPSTTTPSATTPSTTTTTTSTIHTTVSSTSTSSPSVSAQENQPTMAPLAIAVEEPKCEQSVFYFNSKLRGDMNAGLFIDLGRMHVTTEYVKRCCQIESCDLVFLSRDRCYAVDCFNAELCEPVVASAVEADASSIYYVTRNGKSILSKGNQKTEKMKI